MAKEYKGSLDEAIKLGAKLVTGSVTILNKETYKINDNYLGVGKEVTFEWMYKENADVHEIDMLMDAYARASVEHSLAEQKQAKGITATVALEEPVATGSIASVPAFGPPQDIVISLASEAKTPPPPPTESPPSPPEAPQASAPVETHETVSDCSISHQQTDTGIDYLLVKGGNWTKYGVKMWPEKVDEFIKLDWRNWKIGEAFGLPDGFTEAVVQLKPDGKPDRVIGLR